MAALPANLVREDKRQWWPSGFPYHLSGSQVEDVDSDPGTFKFFQVHFRNYNGEGKLNWNLQSNSMAYAKFPPLN